MHAIGATLRAYQDGVVKGVVYVPAASPSPGAVFIPGLLPGTYAVTVSLPGYVSRTFENVVVAADGTTALNGGNAIHLLGD